MQFCNQLPFQHLEASGNLRAASNELGLTIFYSGKKSTEKNCGRLKVWHSLSFPTSLQGSTNTHVQRLCRPSFMSLYWRIKLFNLIYLTLWTGTVNEMMLIPPKPWKPTDVGQTIQRPDLFDVNDYLNLQFIVFHCCYLIVVNHIDTF